MEWTPGKGHKGWCMIEAFDAIFDWLACMPKCARGCCMLQREQFADCPQPSLSDSYWGVGGCSSSKPFR